MGRYLIILIMAFCLCAGKQTRDNSCSLDSFKCTNSAVCIPKSNLCDGTVHCLDRSDENIENCGHVKCPHYQFQCSYGACTSLTNVCDLKNDCADGSDEANCVFDSIPTCRKHKISCHKSNECIWHHSKCDGQRDCSDSSDESYQTCYGTICGLNNFQCDYGACIERDQQCDGQIDCADGSDEINCPVIQNDTLLNLCGSPNSVKCNSGLCINKNQICDGIRDCDDGSDETVQKCGNNTCDPTKYFRCSYGACVSLDNVTCSHCVDNSYKKLFCSLFLGATNDDYTSITTSISSITYGSAPPVSFSSGIGAGFISNRPKMACMFPPIPEHGSYKSLNREKVVPGQRAPPSTTLQFSCDDDFVLNGDPIISCTDNKWNHKLPKCSAKCSPLNSSKHVITCSHNDKSVDCDKAYDGVVANVKCKESFSIQNLVLQPYNGIKCQFGEWSQELFNCEPDCGIQPLSIDGQNSETGEAPWHSIIYKKSKNGNFEQICGGTLISENVIISAAHCFWSFTREAISNSEEYRVAVGKTYRDWSNPKDVDAQYFTVKKIVLPENFHAMKNNYANDIAVLVLNGTVEFNSLIRPVCLDWSETLGELLLQPGAFGNVVGWGLTDERTLNDSKTQLQGIKMPYITTVECLHELPSSLKDFITKDKICGGYTDESKVCNGDGGGGFTFKKSNRYFLQGIASVVATTNNSCDSAEYVTFTNIENHLDWLKNQI